MNYADFWDELHETKYKPSDWVNKPSLFAQWAIQYFPKSGSVLELGAGQAQDSHYFAEKGFTATATDFSPHALELAKQKYPSGITFQQLDLSQPLPFGDELFDVVYAHLSLHYFDTPTTEKVFAEVRRVLKPGGLLAALFNSTSDPESQEGEVIEEPDYRHVANLDKRFFSPETARRFAKDFEIVVADNQGTTYKDEAKGVHNLIRLVARKS